MVQYGLAEDHFNTYGDRVRALTLDDIQDAASQMLRPDNMIWVVVGDREVIEAGIRELGIGPVFEIDADGNVMGQIISDDQDR